jgi:hypothetical protein
LFDGADSPIVNQRVGIRAQDGCGIVEVSRYMVVVVGGVGWMEVSERVVVVGVVEDG